MKQTKTASFLTRTQQLFQIAIDQGVVRKVDIRNDLPLSRAYVDTFPNLKDCTVNRLEMLHDYLVDRIPDEQTMCVCESAGNESHSGVVAGVSADDRAH